MGIKRLTQEEAQGLIKVSDDYTGAETYGFTLTPSTGTQYPAEDGWESVTYYTHRPIKFKAPKGSTNNQWIYVLTNESMPGICKIGFTKNKPSDRAKQINSATGVPIDFTVEYTYPCFNAHDLEQEIHHYLQEEGFRVNNKKEFFNVTVEQAKAVINKIGKPYVITEDESN